MAAQSAAFQSQPVGPPPDAFQAKPKGGFSWMNPNARNFEILSADDPDDE